ncbi:ATP-binding cassette domain-containing protein, partial [Ottowia beijingensis]
MGSDTILETTDLTKTFSGFTAVNKVNLRVRRGSIHALIGPNGAGKTTVFNLLTKFLPVSSGTIRYRGDDITHETPAKTARRGIVRSFQISATFPHLTVLQNVRVALQRRQSASFEFWRHEKALSVHDARAMELLESVGLGGLAGVKAVELPYGRKRARTSHHPGPEPELML